MVGGLVAKLCPIVTPRTVGFSWQEYWSQLPFPSPGDLPDPGIKTTSLISPTLAGWFFTTSATWEALGKMALKVQWLIIVISRIKIKNANILLTETCEYVIFHGKG